MRLAILAAIMLWELELQWELYRDCAGTVLEPSPYGKPLELRAATGAQLVVVIVRAAAPRPTRQRVKNFVPFAEACLLSRCGIFQQVLSQRTFCRATLPDGCQICGELLLAMACNEAMI